MGFGWTPRRGVVARHARRAVGLAGAVLLGVLCVGAAHAQDPCKGSLGGNLRLQLADAVRQALWVADTDRARLEAGFGPQASRYGGSAVGGVTGGTRPLCVPGRADVPSLVTQLWGIQAHAAVNDAVHLRALVLDTFNSAGGSRTDRVTPEYRHTALGVFGGYAGVGEVGLLRYAQRASTLPGEADGWMVSVATLGVRGVVLVGDDAVDAAQVGVGALPVGPVALGGGLRYLHQEGVATAYVDLQDLVLAGRRRFGLMVDSRAELELNTGHLRSATAGLRFTGVGRPDPASAAEVPPAFFFMTLQAMGSVFAGSRLDGTGVDAVPGGGVAWDLGVYGRHAAFAFETRLWANDPLAMDYAFDPTQTLSLTFMARLRIDVGP